MRVAFLKGPRKMILKEVSDPIPKGDEVVVKVKYCGICGSDLHAYETGIYSGVMGHEISGDIESIGESVKGWKIGDRVTPYIVISCGNCYHCKRGETNVCLSQRFLGVSAPGGFAERVALRADLLQKLSDGTSYEEGALTDVLATALRVVMYSVRSGDTVLIMGAGPIGLLAIQCARRAGASRVYVTQVSQMRAEAAKRLGADDVFNPSQVNINRKMFELTKGVGPDVVIECAGKPETIRNAPMIAKKGGKVMIVGECTVDVPINFVDFSFRETEMKGVWVYAREVFRQAVELIERREVDVGQIISDKIGLSEIVEKGFDALLKPGKNHIKILVDPQR